MRRIARHVRRKKIAQNKVVLMNRIMRVCWLLSPFVIFQVGVPRVATATEEIKRSNADLYYFSPEEAKQALGRFGIPVASSGYRFASDVPEAIKTQMREDLSFIGGIHGSTTSPLHKKIFGAVEGSVYSYFFDSRVTEIGMSDCGGGMAVACVSPIMGPSTMWLTDNFVRFSHPQIARLMVVFHEARHTESRNFNWPHASCPIPFNDDQGREKKSIWTGATLAGEPGCDETAFGSYGSSVIMLKNIQKFCTNCTDKVKMDAGLYADDQLGRIVDSSAHAQIENDSYR